MHGQCPFACSALPHPNPSPSLLLSVSLLSVTLPLSYSFSSRAVPPSPPGLRVRFQLGWKSDFHASSLTREHRTCSSCAWHIARKFKALSVQVRRVACDVFAPPLVSNSHLCSHARLRPYANENNHTHSGGPRAQRRREGEGGGRA
jgi:hypothetical protein